ncbi:hypothetical protein [Streptomyces sp. NBC_01744]|uniref:hypothetical protein n=1 Tax=Streptomyces sp. NBC_01744 TaxID=2975927 RepID=UPI003D9A3173|nr:hypothetical protein OIE70_36200 [Streptomyces sp. NBC_01744]
MSDPYLIGLGLTVCSAALVSTAAHLMSPTVRIWRSAHHVAPAPALAVPPGPLDDFPDRADFAELEELGEVDAVDFYLCPSERRHRPHAIHADGSRTCWHCGHNTPGEPVTMTESFEPEYVRPAQADCPDCGCCTAALCEKGATVIVECFGLTHEDTRDNVRGCPCSSETTHGTASWRAGKLRVTMHATSSRPLEVDVEAALRAVAAGVDMVEHSEQLAPLMMRRYVGFVENVPAITELGATYLAARDEPRFTTPVEVETVDVKARTARVIVVGWSLTDGVTVLLDQLTTATKLTPEELPGRFLEAKANCRTKQADDIVLTEIELAPPLPSSWMAQDIPLVEDRDEAEAPAPSVEAADV